MFGQPVAIDEAAYVTVTLAVVNLAHSQDQESDAEAIAVKLAAAGLGVVAGLDAAGFAGLDPSAIEEALLGATTAALEGIGELLGWHPSDPNCDGEVLTRTWVFPPHTLNGDPQLMGPVQETSKSPSECGQDPHSTVTYAALHGALLGLTLPLGRAAAISSVERGTQIFALGFDGRVWTTFFDSANPGPMAGGWSGWFPATATDCFPGHADRSRE